MGEGRGEGRLRRELSKNEGILMPWSREAGHALANAPNQDDQDAGLAVRLTRGSPIKIPKIEDDEILVAIPAPALLPSPAGRERGRG